MPVKLEFCAQKLLINASSKNPKNTKLIINSELLIYNFS